MIQLNGLWLDVFDYVDLWRNKMMKILFLFQIKFHFDIDDFCLIIIIVAKSFASYLLHYDVVIMFLFCVVV